MVRDIIEDIVAQRRAAGDAQLHYLDGLQLFGEADLDDLPDALHPNGDGYVRMGERFAQLAFAGDGPLANAT
jgi:lysophospholipase L1-like esterase